MNTQETRIMNALAQLNEVLNWLAVLKAEGLTDLTIIQQYALETAKEHAQRAQVELNMIRYTTRK